MQFVIWKWLQYCIVLFTMYFFEQENNNNIGLIDSDSYSLLNTYYYGCLSSDDDDVNQPIPTNNNVPAIIINHQAIYLNHLMQN